MEKEKTAKNPVTGDKIKTKQTSDKYRENYDSIFRKEQNNTRSNCVVRQDHANQNL